MAPGIKDALIERAFREGLSMSDTALRLLAERVGFTFTPSGRRLLRRPSHIPKLVMFIAPSAIAEINWAALEAGVDRNVYINKILAEALDVDFNPTGSA
jgi:hypothetical protein